MVIMGINISLEARGAIRLLKPLIKGVGAGAVAYGVFRLGGSGDDVATTAGLTTALITEIPEIRRQLRAEHALRR
jgi:hypothetical protein